MVNVHVVVVTGLIGVHEMHGRNDVYSTVIYTNVTCYVSKNIDMSINFFVI